LQICGWGPTHLVWFGAHTGSSQVPSSALQSAVLAHSVPMLTKPVRSVLQT
jgi:hypothetical protein